MKAKTNKLTGTALDWAVAKCEGMNERIVFGLGSVRDNGYCVERPNGTRIFYVLRNVWKKWVEKCETHPWGNQVFIWTPFTNWSQGGPIIERERIELEWNGPDWLAQIRADAEWYGPTPLIAAMRCYVASKLRDEVEVPEEFMSIIEYEHPIGPGPVLL